MASETFAAALLAYRRYRPGGAPALAWLLDGRGYGELAAELRCSEQVVRQHVSRGLKRLRALIEEHE